MDIRLLTPEKFRANETSYLELLKDQKSLHEIPILNYSQLHEIQDLSLVRFRGMIQDMLDPEIYLEKYEIQMENNEKRMQDGKYRDCLLVKPNETVNFESNSNVHGERRTIFIVSVPGLNDWAKDYEKSNFIKTTSQMSNDQESENVSHGQKRSIDDENQDQMEIDTNEITINKRIRINNENNQEENSSQYLSNEYLLNSPIPDRPSKACMVKIYSDFDSYTLNSIVDVIGFLSVDPALDGSTEQPTVFEDITEIQAKNPPPSLIPRLHAIFINKLDHFNPLLDIALPNDDLNVENFEAIHKNLRIVLTQCLFGDEIAAEYLLSHLISTVYIRTDLQTLGQYSLNLYNIPGDVLPTYTSTLYEIIESLLPASHYFPMTLENMNTIQFVPKKDYKTNKLTSGLLQLAPQTHLILDETRLEPGKLENNGVLGVQNLSYLIKTQQIKCNFEFYEINFDTNIPVMILSEGRSMLPNNCQIPLKTDPESIKLITETLKAAKYYLQTKLNVIRKYLTFSKLSKFEMNPIDTEMIQNDFVEMRRINKNFGIDELHSHLILSRLLGIARGKLILDKECWEMAKQMEIERKKRIENLIKRK